MITTVHVYSQLFFIDMYGMYFLFVVLLYCSLLQLTLLEGLLLSFIYIHACVIFSKRIQKLNYFYSMVLLLL